MSTTRSSASTAAAAPVMDGPEEEEAVDDYKGAPDVLEADEGNPNDGINDDQIDGDLAEFILSAAGHAQPSDEDNSFPQIAEKLKVDPVTCITKPNILVKNGRAWRNDVEIPAGANDGKRTYSEVLMEWFKDNGMLESGTSKFVSGLSAFLLSCTLVGIPYVLKSMHVVEVNYFGASRTKSGEVKVYPPGYRGNFSMNRVGFEKCDFDQKYINYNGALHVLRVLPGEVAVVSVDGSDMILGPGDDGEVGYHVIVNPNVEVKQEQIEAHKLPHLKCGLWHMVHVQKGTVRHVNIDGVDYALFHKAGGHWLMHRKFELGEVYRTTEAFTCRTLYRFIVPNGDVAGYVVNGKSRIVTEACSAWLSTEKPVRIVDTQPYESMVTYMCANLTLLRVAETQRAVVMSGGRKYELKSGTHVLRLPARLVSIVDVAPHANRMDAPNLRDKNNVPVSVNWQYSWSVENTDAYTRWSPDMKEAEAKVERVLGDMVIAMARCIQLTDLYETADDSDDEEADRAGGPSDRVRRICEAKTRSVVEEHRVRLGRKGVRLQSVWVRSVTPENEQTRVEFNRVAEQRAKDYAVRRSEEQEAIMKEVRVASAQRQAEEKRMELERVAQAERRADDIQRDTEDHKRKNEAGMLAARQQLLEQKQRNAAALELQKAVEKQAMETRIATGAAERDAEVALKSAQKSAEVERVKAEARAQIDLLHQQKAAELQQQQAEAEALLEKTRVEAEAERVALENAAKLAEDKRRVAGAAERAQLEAEGNARVASTVRAQRKADFEQQQAERERELQTREREQAVEHARQMYAAVYEAKMAASCPQRELARVVEAVGKAIDATGVTVRGNMTAEQLADTLSGMVGLPVQLQDVFRTEALKNVIGGIRPLATVAVAPGAGHANEDGDDDEDDEYAEE